MNPSQALENAWLLRRKGEIHAALELCVQERARLSLPAQPPTLETMENWSPDKAVPRVDTLVLSASIHRRLSANTVAERISEVLDRFIEAHPEYATFNYYFEKALLHFRSGRYSEALELFLMARSKSQSDYERLFAQSNVLYCLENLGLKTKDAEERLDELFNAVGESPWFDGALAQFVTYKMRKHFRKGEVSSALFCATRRNLSLDQPHYYSLWVRSLPFHSSYEPELTYFDPQAAAESLLHAHYRWRTLNHVIAAEDRERVPAKEIIDRLYLWVWRWLTDPVKYPIHCIANTFATLKNKDLCTETTEEDRWLLRNALEWLELFDCTIEPIVKRFVVSIPVRSEPNDSLLHLEHLFITFCRQKIKNRSAEVASHALAGFKANALYHNPELHFRSLFQAIMGEEDNIVVPLKNLVNSLKTLITPVPKLHGTVVVDRSHSKILVANHTKPLISSPLCEALFLLNQKEVVTSAEFAMAVFGIRQFDAFIHQPKIFNLLNRMKQLTEPRLSFRTKAGKILAEGSWSHIEFLTDDRGALSLSQQPEWHAFAAEADSRDDSSLPEIKKHRMSRWTNSLSREEIQERLGRPRSTTSRLLAQWERKGLIARERRGKTFLYRWVEPENYKELL